eukprot:NODE_1386_length_452_cov_174.532308_g1376_i0.p1 GENE.NODE_1386_length_452_cov_174.532308_g1376_i0~~NODE_1386_length_452_cov_174.532308_g1376_i0.p1  ORF type:complete len:55 (+),score=31.60 NODE_1386_length_452_cov_174.532308_g1376_i0:33-167(+)
MCGLVKPTPAPKQKAASDVTAAPVVKKPATQQEGYHNLVTDAGY